MDDAFYVPEGRLSRPRSARGEKQSPRMSAFDFRPSQILPQRSLSRLNGAFIDNPPPDPDRPSSLKTSQHAPSVVSDAVYEEQNIIGTAYSQDAHGNLSSSENENSFDLKPPPPSVHHSNPESTAERLLSKDHLHVILTDNALLDGFSAFLNRYRPQLVPTLTQYIETQKVLAAVRFANCVADSGFSSGQEDHVAAVIKPKFFARTRRLVDELVNDGLTGYITHRLTQLVTECLVKEITGSNAPIMRDLVQGLAEVYCMTDPAQPDNPIVYASEEFYRTTQYGRDYVIGRNCRFLQGPRTSKRAVSRISDAINKSQEICELLLNYRRDGSPFLNLVLIAPLYDDKGVARYFLGCQIDVSHLVDGGRGLDSFQRLLLKDRSESRYGEFSSRPSINALGELGQLLGEEEIEILRQCGKTRRIDSGRTTPAAQSTPGRRYVGLENHDEAAFWPPIRFGPSGRLPGVYQNYLLVRPYPSMRITFTSAALCIPGLLQSRFLDHIGGPQNVRDGVQESLIEGVGVTAKVLWLPKSHNSDSMPIEGKPRWIHCTPLLGSDDRVGVWMVVMVEKEEFTGSLNIREKIASLVTDSPTGAGAHSNRRGVASSRFTGDKLYAEYLRREGRNEKPMSRSSRRSSSAAPSERSFPKAKAEVVDPLPVLVGDME